MGIATAFGAPIGGLLFAFEELANSFSQALGWQIFFACMVAVLTLDTFKSAQHALNKGHFGLFDGDASTVFFEVRTAVSCWSTSPYHMLYKNGGACHQVVVKAVIYLHIMFFAAPGCSAFGERIACRGAFASIGMKTEEAVPHAEAWTRVACML